MLRFFRSPKAILVSPLSIVFTVALLLGMYFVYYVRDIVILVFLAFLLMTALNPGVKKLEQKYKVPRTLGILLMYLLVMSIISVTVVLIVPPLVDQLQILLPLIHLPNIQDEIKNFRFSLENFEQVMKGLGTSVSTLLTIATSTFNGLISFLTVLVLSFYLLADREKLHLKAGWISREVHHLELAKQLINDVESQLGGWVRGQLILMVIIGIGTFIGLSLLGIPYALPLALLAGLLEILPNLGPTISAVPAIALAYINLGPGMAVATAVFYYVIQWLENNFIVPRIMKDNADVSPVATIVVILIGLHVAGVLGALLAVPIYIVTRLFYSHFLKKSL